MNKSHSKESLEFEDGDDNIDNTDHQKEKETKARKISHTKEIIKAFAPIHLFLRIFGRLPFYITQKASGAYVFRFQLFSLSTLYFFTTSIIFSVIFIMVVLGFVTMFMEFALSEIKDRCQNTWELYTLKRNSLNMCVTVSWLYLTFISSCFLIFRGKEYLHYLNYWNKAVQVIDINPTEGLRTVTILAHVEYMVFFLGFSVLYATGAVPCIQDWAGSLSNAFVRLFMKDIGYSQAFTDVISNHSTNCLNRTKSGDPLLFHKEDYELDSYTILKICGFIANVWIKIYALYGSKCYIIQFMFFCRMLRKLAYVWNERFKNYLHGVAEDSNDPTKRRLERKYLMKDHLIVVQMFKITEKAFSTINGSFYAMQMTNLCAQLYFLSQTKEQSSCDKLFDGLNERKIIMKECFNIDQTAQDKDLFRTSAWFDDPCRSSSKAILQETLVGISLTALTLHTLLSTTMEASLAYEEGMRGFSILRRHCYMFCQGRRERNLIHSLIISFARNNPLQINVGRYFAVNRTLIVVIMGSIFTYYIILLQFRPGSFDTLEYCTTKVCEDEKIKDPAYQVIKDACNETGRFTYSTSISSGSN